MLIKIHKAIKSGGRLQMLLTNILIALLATILVNAVSFIGVLNTFDLKIYDGFFYLRAKLNPRPPGYELQQKYKSHHRPPIVLVAVDEKTLQAPDFLSPPVLWNKEYEEVIKALSKGEARVIGLANYLPANNFDSFVPNYSKSWLEAFKFAQENKTLIVAGYAEYNKGKLLPADIYVKALGSDKLGYFNLTPDDDDFVRRQTLYNFDLKKNEINYSFPYLLAHYWNPELSPISGLDKTSKTVYINFDYSENPFPKFSFIEVYRQAKLGNNEFFVSNFKDSVVLIGNVDVFDANDRPTPLYYLNFADTSRRTTAYIEIVAHTVSTILLEYYGHKASVLSLSIISFILAFLALLPLLLKNRRLIYIVLSWLILFFYLLLCFWVFILNVYVAPTNGILALLIAYLFSLAWHYFTVEQERFFALNAFSHYLSPSVVEKVLNNPSELALGGTRREMTAFFSDLVSFTSLSEKMEPEDLVNLLNAYFSRMTKSVFDLGGTLDKFIGDSMMAFWGAPLQDPKHAFKACHSALNQQKNLVILRAEMVKVGLPALDALMGINTGMMAVGNMGTEERLDYTILGDAVNLASRLVGLNKVYATKILISEATAEEAFGEVEVRRIDHVKVVGRQESLIIYELLALQDELDLKSHENRKWFEEALEFYWKGDFKKALLLFEEALKVKPSDGPSLVFLRRCHEYRATKLRNWEGITVFQEKFDNQI